MNNFKLYLLVDSQSQARIQTLHTALELLALDYKVVQDLNLEWKIEYMPFAGIPWTSYLPDAMGIDPKFLEEKAQKVKKEFGEEWHSICFVVDPANWKADGVGGWNLGRFFSGMSVQIAKFYLNFSDNRKVIAMETAHCWDEQIYKELGIRLNTFLRKDWDEDIVHRKGPDGRYLFEYREDYMTIGHLMIETIKRRTARGQTEQNNMKQLISLLERVVTLYRQLILLRSMKNEPILEKEII